MSRAYDIWIYNQINPDEKSYGGGKKQPPSHSFLEKIPQHLLAVEQKNSLSKTKKQKMEAKPICVVYIPFESGPNDTLITWSKCSEITSDFDNRKPDYHWFFIPSLTHEIMEFKVFYEKDFTPIKYEELKELIQQSLK